MKLFLDDIHFIETNSGIDISISIGGSNQDARAWYVGKAIIEPVKTDQFVGSVKDGGNVNFRNITFNPHGNGTHTECLGHITKEVYSINEHLKEYFFKALLVSIEPTLLDNGDYVITKEKLAAQIGDKKVKALVVRTLPNGKNKLKIDYSQSNPPYIQESCIELLDEMGVEHLLIDLPSVDKENDNGVLAAHHAFWGLPNNPQFHKTITEFIFVSDEVNDGEYLLSLQVAPFENDASPSRPVLYAINSKKS